MTLKGENNLCSNGERAGLENGSHPLEIQGEGSLEAKGGWGGAGIGVGGNADKITITGGTIVASGLTGGDIGRDKAATNTKILGGSVHAETVYGLTPGHPAKAFVYTLSAPGKQVTDLRDKNGNRFQNADDADYGEKDIYTDSGNKIYLWHKEPAIQEGNTATFEGKTVTSDLNGTFSASSAAITGISISPEEVPLGKGDGQAFIATVTGTGAYDKDVTWSLEGNTSSDTLVDAAGVLKVAGDETSETLTLTATAKGDPSKKATAYITVSNDPVVKYNLTVIHGSGGGTYGKGTVLTIQADPAPAGKTFDKWVSTSTSTSSSLGVVPVDATGSISKLTMPEEDVKIEALYKGTSIPTDPPKPPVEIGFPWSGNTGGWVPGAFDTVAQDHAKA